MIREYYYVFSLIRITHSLNVIISNPITNHVHPITNHIQSIIDHIQSIINHRSAAYSGYYQPIYSLNIIYYNSISIYNLTNCLKFITYYQLNLIHKQIQEILTKTMQPNHQDNNNNSQRNNQTNPTTQQQQQPTHEQQQEEEEITPETLQQFNNICLQATQLMNDYKNQSTALKQQIAGMVSIYQKNTSGTNAVPVQKIISITQQYQQGMKQANKQYSHLAQELKNQQQQRDNIMLQIKDCFDKLQRMETKIKAKKLLEKEQKDKLKQQQKQIQQGEKKTQQNTTTSTTAQQQNNN